MKKWQSLLALGFATSAVCTIANPLQASTALPMTLSAAEGTFTITVPDNDTTQSAIVKNK